MLVLSKFFSACFLCKYISNINQRKLLFDVRFVRVLFVNLDYIYDDKSDKIDN